MNDFVLLSLIGLLLFSGCINEYKTKIKYCESLGGVSDNKNGYLGTPCHIKEGNIWKTYFVVDHNGVYGLER